MPKRSGTGEKVAARWQSGREPRQKGFRIVALGVVFLIWCAAICAVVLAPSPDVPW